MAQVTVGTTAQLLTLSGRGHIILQNLGPGNIFFDVDATAASTTGVQIPAGNLYEFLTDAADETQYSVIADAAGTDVRYMIVGKHG